MEKEMVIKKEWQEFREAQLLWFVNRILHLFGWAIVFEIEDETNKITNVYPARVRFRGFSEKCESDGFLKLTKYLSENINQLLEESSDE